MPRGRKKQQYVLATSFEEIEKRAFYGYKKVTLEEKSSLTKMKDVFKKHPEIFIFSDYVEEITSAYTSQYEVSLSKATKRTDHNEEEILGMMYKARRMYRSLLENKSLDHPTVNSQSQTKTQPVIPAQSKKITQSLREQFQDDQTKISAILQGCEPEFREKFGKYLADMGITTLGEFLVLTADSKTSIKVRQDGKKINKDEYNKFYKFILLYVNYNPERPEQKEDSSPTQTRKIKYPAVDDNFVANLRKLPARYFAQNSKEMEKIKELMGRYIDRCIDTLLETAQNISKQTQSEIESILNEQEKEFEAIILEKREEYELILEREKIQKEKEAEEKRKKEEEKKRKEEEEKKLAEERKLKQEKKAYGASLKNNMRNKIGKFLHQPTPKTEQKVHKRFPGKDDELI